MGRFVVKQEKDGYKFDFFSSSGILIASSEPYASKNACMAGIEGIAASAPEAGLHDLTNGAAATSNPKFEIYKDAFGHFRFKLISLGGDVLAVSEGYIDKDSCKHVIDMARKNSADSTIDIQS